MRLCSMLSPRLSFSLLLPKPWPQHGAVILGPITACTAAQLGLLGGVLGAGQAAGALLCSWAPPCHP